MIHRRNEADTQADVHAGDDEKTMARLLHLAGMRAVVDPARAARVKEAVFAEWRIVTRRRTIRRRATTAVGLLSAAAVATFAFRVGLPLGAPPPASAAMAVVDTIEGSGARVRTPTSNAQGAPIRLAGALRIGDRIETDRAGRVGLTLPGGVSVRLDASSWVVLVSPTVIQLGAGAVYVDSTPGAPRLEMRTSFGLVRDIGTQFEVRLKTSSLHVRVRSGVVEVDRGTEVVAARPGTELTVDASGATGRAIAPYGTEWAWAARLSPDFDIEGRSLSAFLDHLSREQGWNLTYADPTLEREASGILLHGSAKGMAPAAALATVLPTTGLTHRVNEGELVVSRDR